MKFTKTVWLSLQILVPARVRASLNRSRHHLVYWRNLLGKSPYFHSSLRIYCKKGLSYIEKFYSNRTFFKKEAFLTLHANENISFYHWDCESPGKVLYWNAEIYTRQCTLPVTSKTVLHVVHASKMSLHARGRVLPYSAGWWMTIRFYLLFLCFIMGIDIASWRMSDWIFPFYSRYGIYQYPF